MKDFLKSFEKGAGLGVGFFLVAILFVGVYAFVEPSSGPSTDFYFDSNSPINSNKTIEFVGFTAAVDGDFGSVRDANILCDGVAEGSRWMTYDDFLEMSHLYNYTYQVWIPDAVGPSLYSRDGERSTAMQSGGLPGRVANCFGYSTNNGGFSGGIIDTDGYITTALCSATVRLACVKGQ